MGGVGSGRWGDYERRPTVDEVERINVAFDRIPGVDVVVVEQIPGLKYQRFVCVGCRRACQYLYAVEGNDWVCARCGGVSYAVSQAPHAPTYVERKIPGIRLLRRHDWIVAKMDACPYRAARWRCLLGQRVKLIDQLHQLYPSSSNPRAAG